MARERFITYSRNLIIEVLGEDGHEVCKEIDLLPDEEEQYRSYKEILHLLSGQEAEVKAHDIYAVPPVNMDKFMRDKFYMGKGDAVVPQGHGRTDRNEFRQVRGDRAHWGDRSPIM